MNRIKQLREEKNIFQKDLAKLLHVSVPSINYYENEKRAIDTKTASILADYFDVSLDYLLGKSDIRNPEKEQKIIHTGLDTTNLTEENKQILEATYQGLLAKQNLEEKHENEKRDTSEA